MSCMLCPLELELRGAKVEEALMVDLAKARVITGDEELSSCTASPMLETWSNDRSLTCKRQTKKNLFV